MQNEKTAPIAESSDRKSRGYAKGKPNSPASMDNSNLNSDHLIQALIAKENLVAVVKRVESNKGAAGCDSLEVSLLREYLQKHWPRIKSELLDGTYKPLPVKRVEIPKPGGGMRKLGIPSVVDRFIQQALHQILSPIFEPIFSQSSFGFRVGRSAHDAVLSAKEHMSQGYRFVVDLDLDSFFDRVNHDILMSRVARKVKDKKVLLLIRRYLQSGVLIDGVIETSSSGTPQGGPLSLLLSNILLDDLDKELEWRGHRFCRYADDVNIYVRSKRSGERVLASVSHFIESRLKLKINYRKSAVARPWDRKFLGYSVTMHKKPRLRVALKSLARLKASLKQVLRRGRGRNLGRFVKEELNPILRGWGNFFYLSETKLSLEELNKWIRHRLRCLLWKQWKKPKTRFKRLVALGINTCRASESVSNGRGSWWNSGASHINNAIRNKHFEKIGLISVLKQVNRMKSLA